MDIGTSTLVIARYDEDISWAKDMRHVVIQKDKDIPNKGREISSWFWFILSNYDTLEGTYIFAQGHPFDHAKNITDASIVVCDKRGAPHHSGLPIHEVADALGLPLLDHYEFRPGAQHQATATQIRSRSYEWWAKAFWLSLNDEKQYPWVFERLIKYLYN